MQINGVEYKFKQGVSQATNKRFIGYIAQQIESVVPEAVQLIDGILHVDYESLIPYLSESIKQNYNDMQEISSDFERVKAMLDMLYNQFAGLGKKPKLYKKPVHGRSRFIVWTIGALAFAALIVAALVGLINFNSHSQPTIEPVINNEREMLLELYEILRPNDTLPRWNFTTPHCNWTGILCNSTSGRVVMIDLPSFAMEKSAKYFPTIPASIGNFSDLEVLDLGLNYIGSTIPESIQNLKNLQFLSLHGNELTGTVPDLRGLPNLLEIWLHFNQLTGPLEMLVQIPAIQTLRLNMNPLASTLPHNISESLAVLHLMSCNLIGSIPESWTKFRFTELDLTQNKLRGSIPCFADSLLTLFASENDFDGEFCGSSLKNLEELYLMYTKLTGVFDLPNTDLTNMKALVISYNRFTAFLPSSPEDIQGPEECLAPYNSFKCPLPAWSELQCKATCESRSSHTGHETGPMQRTRRVVKG